MTTPEPLDPFESQPAPDLDIDLALGGDEPPLPDRSDVETPPIEEEPPGVSRLGDETRPLPAADNLFDDAFADDETKAPAATAPTAAPAKPESADGVVFEETYSAAESGKQPPSWSGDYDFASLTVSTDKVASGSEASLRFEKRSGTGSALFARKFADAKGTAEIEFDLCCESKNQYLLGIYFEHDGNFRQSVHTVIHLSEDTVSIRLQGKSAPYEFGQWVHVKFRIDLAAGVVDGTVDGKPVARRVPLVSIPEQDSPPSINTISIRDTLASEGVFYLDNIRVRAT
jgi:hypothetical protein